MNCYYCNKERFDFWIHQPSNLKSIYFCCECISVFSGIEACKFVEKIREQLKSTAAISSSLPKRGSWVYVNMHDGAVRIDGWLNIKSVNAIFSRQILKELSVFI